MLIKQLKQFISYPSRAYNYLLSRCLLLALFSFLITSHAFSQATIFGKILDEQRKPLPLAGISVYNVSENAHKLITQITAQDDGKFSVSVPSNKDISVIFSFISYKSDTVNLKLKTGEKKEIIKILVSISHNLNPVDIKGQNMNITPIEPKFAHVIPNVSGGIEALIKTMPGVASNSELSSQYSVRGGNYDENLVYVNDVEIYRPLLITMGQQEGLSFVNPDLVQSLQFSAGGFDARFGDKMSSVLDIKYKKPVDFGGSVTLSLLGGAAHLEGSVPVGHRQDSAHSPKHLLRYLIGVRQKYDQYILKGLETKGDYKPSFTDVQGLIDYEISKKLDISFLGNYSRNHFKFIPHSRTTTFGTIQQTMQLDVYFEGQEVDAFDTYMGALTATYNPNDKLSLKFIASGFNDAESETFDILGQYYINQVDNNLGSQTFGKATTNLGAGGFLHHARDYLNANVFSLEHMGILQSANSSIIRWGIKFNREFIDVNLNQWNLVDSSGFTVPHPADNPGYILSKNKPLLVQNLVNTSFSLPSDRISGYIQKTWNIESDSTVTSIIAGLRSGYWDANHQFLIGPRATVSYKPKWKENVIFRYSTGLYYQPPFYRELVNINGDVNTNIKSQNSIHLVGAMDWNFNYMNRPFKFVAEIYYKYLYNIIPYQIQDVNISYYNNLSATGYAYGMDFKINGEFVRTLESWASLSILQTNQYILYSGYGSMPRPNDQRVTFSMFFQDYLPMNPTYKMYISFIYGTGIPFGPPNSPPEDQNLRMPSFLRVDIGFSKLIKSEDNPLPHSIFRNFKNIWVCLEVLNLLGANNTISYTWVKDVNNQQFAVPNYLTPRTLNLKLYFDF